MLSKLENKIESLLGEVRTEGIDVSFGEVINLHVSDPKELVISPEYQRLFRWSHEQRSRLIESILIGLPIPQIFTIENEDGVLELVDGLQRISSVIHFIDHTMIEPVDVRQQVAPHPLKLIGCDLVKELNDMTYESLPQKLKFNLKRARVRMVTIKQSKANIIRYEMFKRLNTGGSDLSPQEIRNCTVRMLGKDGIKFYSFLTDLSDSPEFQLCIEPLGDIWREKMTDHELVLRFFACKNYIGNFRGNVSDWLDDYMEKIALGQVDFDFDREKSIFDKEFSFLAKTFGAGSFVRYKNGRPIGGLAPAYFEAVTQGVLPFLDELASKDKEQLSHILIQCLESNELRNNTGGSANTKAKFEGRVRVVQEAFEKIL